MTGNKTQKPIFLTAEGEAEMWDPDVLQRDAAEAWPSVSDGTDSDFLNYCRWDFTHDRVKRPESQLRLEYHWERFCAGQEPWCTDVLGDRPCTDEEIARGYKRSRDVPKRLRKKGDEEFGQRNKK
jgi:hypothetical protein